LILFITIVVISFKIHFIRFINNQLMNVNFNHL